MKPQDAPPPPDAINLMRQVRSIEIRSRKLVDGLLSGQYESAFKGQGMAFREVREYVPGDEYRLLDWNVTARTGRPHVKVMAEERELTVMLMVDVSASQAFGSAGRLKSRSAAEFCALIATAAMRNNDRTGLVLFSGEVELYLRPSKGRRHALRLIRETLAFIPRQPRTDIPGALGFLSKVLRRRAVVFVISDFIAQDFAQSMAAASRRHDVIAVVMGDPREHVMPDVGLAAIKDPETGRELLLDTASDDVRAAYAAAMANWAAKRDRSFREARLDVIPLDTTGVSISALHRFFALRERRHV